MTGTTWPKRRTSDSSLRRWVLLWVRALPSYAFNEFIGSMRDTGLFAPMILFMEVSERFGLTPQQLIFWLGIQWIRELTRCSIKPDAQSRLSRVFHNWMSAYSGNASTAYNAGRSAGIPRCL
jgi:hypothetical protein